MDFINCLKREVRCINTSSILLYVAFALLAGALSPVLFGNMGYFYCLILPPFSLNAVGFIIFWIIMLALLGISAGIFIDGCRCTGVRRKSIGLLLYIANITSIFLWYPVFFCMRSMLLSLILAMIVLLFSFIMARYCVRISLLATVLMIIHTLWCLYCVILNFCILIIN